MYRITVNRITLAQGVLAFKEHLRQLTLYGSSEWPSLPRRERFAIGPAACIELVRMGYTKRDDVLDGLATATNSFAEDLGHFLDQMIGSNQNFYPLREVEGQLSLQQDGLRDEYPDVIWPIDYEGSTCP